MIDRILSIGTFVLLAAVLGIQGYNYRAKPKQVPRVNDVIAAPIELEGRAMKWPNPFVRTVDSRTFKLFNAPDGKMPEGLIALVEFSDFECPFCKKFATEIGPEIEKAHPNLVRVFVNNPLTIHKDARRLAELGLCQPDFWAVYLQLFAKGEGLTCRVPGDPSQVDKDMALATSFGFTGTPSFVLGPIENGRVIPKKVIRGAQSTDVFVSTIKSLGEKK